MVCLKFDKNYITKKGRRRKEEEFNPKSYEYYIKRWRSKNPSLDLIIYS